MANGSHFTDWSSLPAKERSQALAICKQRLLTLGKKLHAVASEIDVAAEDNPPLHRLPYVAKDLIGTGRAAPSWGCKGEFASGTASIIERLEAAGACLIGTAEMTELAYEPSGLNASRGNVLNPWDFERVPGGSSSGSAALVAAGCCFAALGSDTGGSVRIPAHCCGVTALKPTWGRIPIDGCMPLAPNLDTIGMMARSAKDVALMWSALFGPDVQQQPAAQLVLLEDAFDMSDPDVARLCRDAAFVLNEAGFACAGRSGFPELADRHCLTVMQFEAAHAHRDRLDDVNIDPVLRRRLGKGLSIPENNCAGALAERERLHDEFVSRYLADAAGVLLPAVPIKTPSVEEVDPSRPRFSARTLYALSSLTRFVNFLGLPAIALPAGVDDRGMPVALQIVGRRGDEHALLRIAAVFQTRTDWHGRVPAAVAVYLSPELRV